MKSKASGFYADSLEMLLDTMCNVLGAIVFITLVLAALGPSSHAPAREELQQQTEQLSNTLASVTASDAAAQAELQQLALRLQDPHLPFQTNQMRLPSARRADRQSWPVIVRYGQLFPLYLPTPNPRGQPPQNLQTLEWRQVRGRGVFVEPKPNQGTDPESGTEEIVQALARNSRTNFYLTFWVYDDSFPAFNRAKETAMRLGFQYGWEPVTRGTPLQLGRNAENIPLQN